MDKKELTCNKCGYTWTPRKDPKYCPLCKQLLYSIAEIVAKQKEKREGGK
jgi:rubrerythrin